MSRRRSERDATRAERRAPRPARRASGDAGEATRGRGVAPDAATRQRLLDVARRLFAERGLHQVTVREICREAGANLAGINYYFGDKLGLYREIVERTLEGLAHRDPTVHAPRGSSPEERIRHYVRNYIPRLANPEGPAVWMQKLMAHEMENPTPLAPWIAERVILPRVRFLSHAVAELIDCPVDDPRVGRCVVSLQAQCLFYLPNRFRKAALPAWDERTRAELDAVADHVAEFSIAGIRRIAREGAPAAESGDAPGVGAG